MPVFIQEYSELFHGTDMGGDVLDPVKGQIMPVDNKVISKPEVVPPFAVEPSVKEAPDVLGEDFNVLKNDDNKEPDDSLRSEDSTDSDGSKIEEAERHFIRKDGIIYVQDDKYKDLARDVTECHVYVGLSATEAIRKAEGSTEGVQRLNQSQLPSRIRIVNKLALAALSGITGMNCDPDHVAPFRTLVLFEQELRQRHQLQELEFAETSRNCPTHRAVVRVKPHLPDRYAYLDGNNARPSKNNGTIDNVDEARILLDGLRALMQVFDTDLEDLIAAVKRLNLGRLDNDTPRLPFSYLWYLFNPGQEIVSLYPKPRVYRVLQATGGRRSLVPRRSDNGRLCRTVSDLTVDCFSLDFNGKEFGAKPHVFRIQPYDDFVSITNLPIYPLKFAEEGLKELLIERGHRFKEFVTASHQRYKGLSLKEGDRFYVFEEIDSDVIVDFQLAFQNAEAKISAPIFGSGVIQHPTVEDEEERWESNWAFDDPELLRSRWHIFSQNTDLLRNQQPGTLTQESYILLPYRVYGYVLLNRKWLPLDIDLIKKVPEIKPGENDGFQKLVLPDGHKDIVRALVSAHSRQITLVDNLKTGNVRRNFDLVKGKGRGLIILLHGTPGVGKTSTAECVAANAGRPLLPITCGDLGGVNAKEVEQNLENFFDLARKWGCVLLLDEADVFLSARDRGDIRQISLVSVFLRVLEYYSGILILTTNRVGSFDEAIKSRVHCALYYPPLDRNQSLKIWKMNLNILDERNKGPDPALRIRFDREEIEEFAERHWESSKEGTRWNGRQIKNAFQTATALADWDHFQNTGGNLYPEGPLLRKAHFKIVAQASSHFDEYLMEVRGTDQFRAKTNEVRRDDIRSRDLAKKKSSKASSSKSKSKSKHRPKSPSPEPSDESSEEGTEDDEKSATSGSESESEEAARITPPPSAKKKSNRKKGSN